MKKKAYICGSVKDRGSRLRRLQGGYSLSPSRRAHLSACFPSDVGISANDTMPALKNNRHELFAQELASGKSVPQAYVAAGFRANRGNAHTTKQRQDVSTRTAELLAQRQRKADRISDRAIEKAALSKEWVLKSLRDNYERALATDQGAVANKALELLGKEIGMFITRSEQGPPGAFAELSDEQLRAGIAAELAESGVSAEIASAFAGIQPANTNEGRNASDEDYGLSKAS